LRWLGEARARRRGDEVNGAAGTVDGQVQEQVRALWRRRWLVAATFAAGTLAALLVALLTPPVYQSSATILIEQQEIPQDFVRSTITSFADQRIQVISQRVMTTQNLVGIIERNDLYPDERRTEPREVVVQRMREDVRMKMISADVIDPRSGSPVRATIAFSLSYRNANSELAYKVASELTSLYLNENLSARAKQTQQALTFLEDEGNRLSAQIASLEKQIADFKQRHADRLPTLGQINLSGVDRTELEIRDLGTRLSLLDQQETLIRAQLAQISPTSPLYTDGGGRVLTPSDRLKALKSQIAGLRARYGPDHPDVIATQLQIDGLEKQASADADANEIARRLDDARTRLAEARTKYSDEHPDVRRLSGVVATLERTLAESPKVPRTVTDTPDNPAYIQVKAQLDTLLLERAQLQKSRDELRARLADFERRVAESPDVERQLVALTRDYETAYRKYQDVRAKQLEAQASQNLETERKGERFTLIEPPMPSEAPVSPRRGLILVLGTFLSALLGLGVGVVTNQLDSRVRGPGDLLRVLEVPPLAQLPVMLTAEDLARARRRLRWSIGGAVGSVVGVALFVHLLWRPLDVVLLQIIRRFGA
jgi:uncharacterized protein involved in exopolysaccharide biosynthesis